MRLLILLPGLLLLSPALAGEAEICYSANVALGSYAPPSNATVFECPIAGNKTLPQLAVDGWKVVQLVPIVTSGSTQANQLVIQR